MAPTHATNVEDFKGEVPVPLSIEKDGGGGDGDGADGAAPPPPLSPELQSALRKVSRRVVPICFLVSLMNHLDRSNLSYAALSFNRDNGFDAKTYALGASLFFVSFTVFQVPANLVMVRVGFRLWLALLLVGWGCVAVCFMFISSAWSFFLLRLLLGVFEAGAFPAMWYALSEFFPRRLVTKPYAYLTIGIMVANMVGAPLAAGLLAMDGIGGLRGWQWLFLLEGVPSVLLGVLVYVLMPSSIQTARFLTQPERDALAAEVARDHVPGPLASDLKGAMVLLRQALANGYFYLIFASGFLLSIAATAFGAFLPIIIANMLSGTAFTNQATVAAGAGAKSSLKPVALAVVPYAVAVVLTWAVAHSSQRRNELFFHLSACLFGSGLLMTLFAPIAQASLPAGFVVLSLMIGLCFAPTGPGMALVARLCRGREQVIAQPLSNSISLLGSVIAPLMVAALIGRLGGFKWVAIMVGIMMLFTSLLVLVLRWWVMRDGGLPDGGVGARYASQSGVRARAPPRSDWSAAALMAGKPERAKSLRGSATPPV